jgi:hypothetical protein
VSNVEQPKYNVVESSSNIEVRDYEPMIVAEAEVSGERREAIGKGFRIIADYIFGNNNAAQKVRMTAPVTQQGSEKIAMTAPAHLKQLGFSHMSARPRHPAQDGETIEAYKKTSRAH